MDGQKPLRFHKKYLNLCFKDEWKSGMTWAWRNDDIIFIFGWNIALLACSSIPERPNKLKKNGQQNAPDMRWTAFTNTSCIWGHMHWQLVIIMAELMAAFPAPHWLWECAPLYCTAVNTARKMLRMHHDDRRYRKHFSWQTTTSSINLPHRRSSSSQQQSPRCTAQKPLRLYLDTMSVLIETLYHHKAVSLI